MIADQKRKVLPLMNTDNTNQKERAYRGIHGKLGQVNADDTERKLELFHEKARTH
jgi:hypothetical protein